MSHIFPALMIISVPTESGMPPARVYFLCPLCCHVVACHWHLLTEGAQGHERQYPFHLSSTLHLHMLQPTKSEHNDAIFTGGQHRPGTVFLLVHCPQ